MNPFKINKSSTPLWRVRPGFVIVVSLVLVIALFLSAFFELRQTKREIYQIMQEEAATLMTAITTGGANAIYSYHQIEELIEEKLLSVARLVDRLEKNSTLTPQILADIAAENEIFRINIFNEKREKILSSYQSVHHDEMVADNADDLDLIFNGRVNEHVIGIRESRHQEGKRFAVAVHRSNGGAIVVNIDAQSILEFRKTIGVGRLMQDISTYPGIEYIVLQDRQGIILATPGITRLNSVASDSFLQKVLQQQQALSRTRKTENSEVFEFVKPFLLYNEPMGLLRIGLNTDHLSQANNRLKRRMIIMSIVMGFFMLIAVNFLTINQNYQIINEAYQRIKTYSGNILEHMADAVVAIDRHKRITLFNSAAGDIFGIEPSRIIGKQCETEINADLTPLLEALQFGKTVTDMEKTLHLEQKNVIALISTSVLTDRDGEIDSAFAVIKDLTEKRHLEESLQQKEKLTAMGQLASGVAHEIRNPLNAIGMISQRLNKEFEPAHDAEEYRQLSRTIVSEVERINQIIQQFLKFARPPRLELMPTNINTLLKETVDLVATQAQSKNVRIEVDMNDLPDLRIDQNLLKQALLNLLQNGIDAIEADSGMLQIHSDLSEGRHVRITISDTGAGIPKDIKSKIFNLYFTTKATGTGLGLSLVHQIISQHNGRIEVDSMPDQGTTFAIYFPILNEE